MTPPVKPVKMTPFPFLRLPFIPQKDIIQQLGVAQVIELSIYSTRFKKVAEFAKYSVHEFKLEVVGTSSVRITKNYKAVKLHMWDRRPFRSKRMLPNCKLDGELFKIMRTKTFHQTRVLPLDPKSERFVSSLDVSKAVANHLNFLQVQKYKVDCRRKQRIQDLIMWNYSIPLRKFEYLPTDNNEISVEELHYIFEQIGSKFTKLNVSVPGYTYRKPLVNHPNLWIRDPTWLDFSTFSIAPDSKSLEFVDVNISHQEVNRFFIEWIDGEHETLEKLIFRLKDDSVFDYNGIWDEIHATEMNFLELDLHTAFGFDPETSSMEFKFFRREDDDRSATVVTYKNYVGMFIWHAHHWNTLEYHEETFL